MKSSEEKSSYQFESVILSSDRLKNGLEVDISNSISDLEIFEHIEKPYLTGQIAFSDNDNLVSGFDFQGGERITINMSPTNLVEEGRITSKVFRVEKIMGTYKSNDKNEAVFLKLIEDIGYTSSVKNVNKSYQGSPITIIQNILSSKLQ